MKLSKVLKRWGAGGGGGRDCPNLNETESTLGKRLEGERVTAVGRLGGGGRLP